MAAGRLWSQSSLEFTINILGLQGHLQTHIRLLQVSLTLDRMMGGFVLNYGGFVVFCWFVLLDRLDSIFALNCLPYSVIYDDRLATD